jgi:hypothetical protein
LSKVSSPYSLCQYHISQSIWSYYLNSIFYSSMVYIISKDLVVTVSLHQCRAGCDSISITT